MSRVGEYRFLVSEVFESLQGEGPFCCRRALFVRLAGCNLRCPFCDTKYSLDPARAHHIHFDDLYLYLRQGAHDYVVFTGGEPMLQWKRIRDFVERVWLKYDRIPFQVETNGTLPFPTEANYMHELYFVVSPKDVPVAVPGASTHSSWVTAAKTTGRVYFKFLVSGPADVKEVNDWVQSRRIPRNRVYLMPLTTEGMDKEELIKIHRAIASLAVAYRFNFSPRLHLLLGLR